MQGINQISQKFMEAIQSRLFQWVGKYSNEGGLDVVDSMVDSNAEEEDVGL